MAFLPAAAFPGPHGLYLGPHVPGEALPYPSTGTSGAGNRCEGPSDWPRPACQPYIGCSAGGGERRTGTWSRGAATLMRHCSHVHTLGRQPLTARAGGRHSAVLLHRGLGDTGGGGVHGLPQTLTCSLGYRIPHRSPPSASQDSGIFPHGPFPQPGPRNPWQGRGRKASVQERGDMMWAETPEAEGLGVTGAEFLVETLETGREEKRAGMGWMGEGGRG